MEKQDLIFISGGVRSGKSTFAEKYAISLANQENLHYIATSKPSDDEMKSRINQHQKDRETSGRAWKTWECPSDIHWLAPSFQENDIVLLDCLTLLLTNELFSSKKEDWNDKMFQQNVMQSILQGIDMIQQRTSVFLIVSNEVLNEPLADDPLVQTYARLLGELHQQIVKRASEAYLVESGFPLLMKGK